MKKKILAMVLSLVLVGVPAMAVLADSSSSTTSTESTITVDVTAEETNEDQAKVTIDSDSALTADDLNADGYALDDLNDATITDMATQIANVLNDLSSVATLLDSSELAKAAKDTSYKVAATVLAYVDIEIDTATKNSDGTYTVTLELPNVAANEEVLILHYDDDAEKFETIKPTSVESGTVTFNVSSFSPFAFVKLDVSTPGGDTAPIVLYVLLAVAALAVIAVVSRKYLKAAK